MSKHHLVIIAVSQVIVSAEIAFYFGQSHPVDLIVVDHDAVLFSFAEGIVIRDISESPRFCGGFVIVSVYLNFTFVGIKVNLFDVFQ